MLTQLQQKIQPWLQRLSRQRSFYYAERWHLHDSSSLMVEQVIGRDQCQYICLDLNHLPANKRANALKYQILSHSPWPNPQYQVAWQQGFAQLWLWPTIKSTANSQNPIAVHAEAVFWQPPKQDGLYLYQCASGFDLQYWKQGRLQASQWFAQEPQFANQQWLARSQGVTLTEGLVVQTPELQSHPWPSVRANPIQKLTSQQNSIIKWTAFGFVLIASVQLGGWAQYNWQSGSYQKQRQQLEQQLGSVLEQRTAARENLARYQQLEPLLQGLNPLHIQQLLTERLRKVAEFEVVNWSRQDLTADLTIETDSDSTLAMVNALRAAGIKDAQAQPGTRAKQYRLNIQLELPLPWPEALTQTEALDES